MDTTDTKVTKKALRSTGTAVLQFGLISIPVKLYAGSTESAVAIKFNQLHGACGSRLRQQYTCEHCTGTVVERDQMVKGYEYEKGRYVTFSADEFEKLEAASDAAMAITEFVFEGSVNAIYLDKPYYLVPDKGAAVPYALFQRALAASGREAICKYAARGKMHVCLIRAMGEGLLLIQLRYPEEVRTVEEMPLPDCKEPSAEQIEMATTLIESQASAAFDPAKYHDEVRDRMLKAIEYKVEHGQAAPAEAASAPGGQVLDLMEALKASLAHKAA